MDVTTDTLHIMFFIDLSYRLAKHGYIPNRVIILSN
jgi:hypothetical protein